MRSEKLVLVTSWLALLALFLASCAPAAIPSREEVKPPAPKAETQTSKAPSAPAAPSPSPKPGVSMYPYASYCEFFVRYFGNVLFVTFAFLLWIGITIILIRALRIGLWLKVPLIAVISATYYLLFGLLIAPGFSGGTAEFLYDPVNLVDNLYAHGGLRLILLWWLELLPTGGIWIVLPIFIFGFGFWYSRPSSHPASPKRTQ